VRGARGDRARVPSQKTVGRWLERWVEDGLMERDNRAVQGRGKNPVIYRVARALSPIGCPLSDNAPEFFQRRGSISGHEEACPLIPESEVGPDEGGAQGAALKDTPLDVQKSNPVPDCDLGDYRIKDTPTGTTRAHVREENGEGPTCWEEDYRLTVQTAWECALHLSLKRAELNAPTGQMDNQLHGTARKLTGWCSSHSFPLGNVVAIEAGAKGNQWSSRCFQQPQDPPSSRSAPAKFAYR
jgi:hypothetical protein